MHLDTNFVEVVFLAKLPALSASKFKVFICSDEPNVQNVNNVRNTMQLKEKTQVYCLRCPNKGNEGSALGVEAFVINKLPDEVIQLENTRFVLTFDADTKLLASIKDKKRGVLNKEGIKVADTKESHVEIQFGAYPTQQFRNGAYLFSTDSRRQENADILKQRSERTLLVLSTYSIAY